MRLCLPTVVGLACALSTIALGDPTEWCVYVDDDASSNGDGASWSTAYKYLQDALAEASTSGLITEIRVAQGTYKPDLDERGSVAPGVRTETFQLLNGAELRGGYAGLGAPDPNLRDVDGNASILSGDLAGNDIPTNGPDVNNNGENSYNVVTGTGIDATATLDGFTVIGGNGDGAYPNNAGGGMYGNSGTVRNCTFKGNWAIWGGGMAVEGNTLLVDCAFTHNTAEVAGGLYWEGSSATIDRCTFAFNRHNSVANLGGGGMYITSSGATISCCEFAYNTALGSSGGGVYVHGGGTFINCLFVGNFASAGGGMWKFGPGGNPTVINATFVGNTATGSGGGLQGGGGYITATNCIIWGNSAPTGAQIAGDVRVTHSDIEGGVSGTGNINADPIFVDTSTGNPHVA